MLRSAALIALIVGSVVAESSADAAGYMTIASFGSAEPRI
jgi:hypothetical protein